MVEQVFALKYIVASIVYSLIGIVILVFSFAIFDWLTPHKLWEEIVDKQNLPLAIALGAMTIAVGNIIASAIHG
jgi:putative membrane protein